MGAGVPIDVPEQGKKGKPVAPGGGGTESPKAPRLLVDMRKVYLGRVKEGQEGLREIQKVLIAQLAARPSEFLKDLQRLEKEQADRIQEWRLAKMRSAKVEVKAEAAVGRKEEDLQSLCDRLISEAKA